MLIRGGKVLTMEGTVFEPGFVRIAEGKIESLGPLRSAPEAEEAEEAEEGEQVLEVPDTWIMPGLIEAHCHIGITEEPRGAIDDDCNEASGPVQPYLRGLDAVNPMDPAFHNAIRAGITSVGVGGC